MAFNLLANLTRSSPSTNNSSPVDAEEGELDESDFENGPEEEEEGSGMTAASIFFKRKMADIVDLVSDGEHGDDIPGPTRAELKPSVCSHEEAWFKQAFCSPDEVIDSSIPEEHVKNFQDLIWNTPHDRMVPGYGNFYS
ncbi:hypothetical protein ElyMa_003703300 [Elysia marginata]|uniref:Uncharacterized protein n=1 Tax=Elysia marginata TaxID=1093978 RepID=A0AAV4F1R2_9GAST|nr:hypothetical protein ElyMa_003703300 [Elysia marginata]